MRRVPAIASCGHVPPSSALGLVDLEQQSGPVPQVVDAPARSWLFLMIPALAHGVIAVIVGAIFLASVCRGSRRERLTYPAR